jgi:hypothetical protein
MNIIRIVRPVFVARVTNWIFLAIRCFIVVLATARLLTALPDGIYI